MTQDLKGRRLQFAYYCSGHGYGHATRVSAFTCHLLRLEPKPIVHIISSAPKHVFADSVALGVIYRNAHIDPVIVQPLAYRVDREKSVQVLNDFLEKKHAKMEEESQWLRRNRIDCVLSDAAFLGCVAANAVGIPSVLITNFTFDSVYSYLSTPFVDTVNPSELLQAPKPALPPDISIPLSITEPLAEELRGSYRCADLLLRLPGAIPIPSFSEVPSLPSPSWIELEGQTFTPDVHTHLRNPPSTYTLLPQIPFPPEYPQKKVPRSVIDVPLLVRSPNPSVFTSEGRRCLLDSIGVPKKIQDSSNTKILIVSFGGQVFHKPHSHSRSPSNSSSPGHSVLTPSKVINSAQQHPKANADLKHKLPSAAHESASGVEALSEALRSSLLNGAKTTPPRVVQNRPGQSVLIIPGAPPASIPNSPIAPTAPVFSSIVVPATPKPDSAVEWSLDLAVKAEEEEAPYSMLPDDSWIAIVCGVPKDWAEKDGEDMPENFFVAPKDVYMPDLTAVADVLLGKLGYGTVSECIDACTPFVYVSRPLFVEEHGLRLLLEREGVGIELPREAYEAGDWASATLEAYNRGKERKQKKRAEGETGRRLIEGREMAMTLVHWVTRWQSTA